MVGSRKEGKAAQTMPFTVVYTLHYIIFTSSMRNVFKLTYAYTMRKYGPIHHAINECNMCCQN